MEIDIKYINEIKKNSSLNIEMIKKDLVLSYLLQEFNFENLVFKGGTLLSKGHLKYHRLSEDLDFTYLLPNFNSKTQKLKFIKSFIKEEFIPKLILICNKYGLDFNNDIEDDNSNRYCPVKQSDFLFRFNVYLNKKSETPIKIEINFLDKCYFNPENIKIIHINSNSKYLVYPLFDFSILSYNIEEVILEKFRSILTREKISMRDFFDLYLISKEVKDVFDINFDYFFSKLKDSGVYLKDRDKFDFLINSFKNRFEDENVFYEIEDMVLIDFNRYEYEEFVIEVFNFLCEIIEKLD